MKVKFFNPDSVFNFDRTDGLEKKVNKFLSENSSIEVVKISYISLGGVPSVMLAYNEK